MTENLDGGEFLFAFRMLMVLFRREFSFVDSLYLWEVSFYWIIPTLCNCLFSFIQLIWSMEYNPHLFSIYESDDSAKKDQDGPGNDDLMRYGKFERENVKSGQKYQEATLSIFLVASVLESKNKRLLQEAKGLDDVVKVGLFPPFCYLPIFFPQLFLAFGLSYWWALMADTE
ncbi:hypothetical protein GW17_00036832 [Ensete ventricosum]|nr:hypothetical protein GW17_00036832 [Ensete ventricosum]